MPRMDGYEVCQELKADPATRGIPVIFVSAFSETLDKLRAFSVGGADYVTKPFEAEEVLARIDHQLKIGRFQAELERRNSELARQIEYANSAMAAADEATQSKNGFLASVTHELRTPLNGILGYCELLIENLELAERGEDVGMLRRIKDAARHQLRLINDILDLSKIEAGKMSLSLESFDLHQLVELTSGLVAPLVAANENRLTVIYGSDPGQMFSDSTRVRQVLFNLLSNACKFTQRGVVTLEVSRHDPGWVDFRVSDTGIGMGPDQVRNLFQPFAQGGREISGKFGGTGLGLAISRRLCEMLRGEISVHSETGHGTTFVVHLPASPAQS
jgi:signal transduction histidine kinase